MDVRMSMYLGVLLAVPLVVLCQSSFKYDCRRKGHSALCTANTGATCDTATGTCICPAPTDPAFNDYLCAVFTPSTDCSPTCSNGGQCSSGSCVCAAGFYGTDCGIPRALVYCADGKMFININPQNKASFQGVIGVLNKQETVACQLKIPANDATYEDYIVEAAKLDGYNLEITHSSPECGDATQSDAEPANTGQMYARKFIIQYNADMMSSVDQIITGNCKLVEGSNTIAGAIESVQGADVDTSNLDDLTVDGEVDSVTMTVVNDDGSNIATTVNIGQPIKLKFTLATAYADFKVASCIANNAIDESSDDYRSFDFITAGCPNDDNLAMFNGAITKNATSVPNVIDIPIKVFMFVGASSKVAFNCTVTLCKADDVSSCVDTTCSGTSSSDTSPSSRKKRDAPEQKEMHVAINVVGPEKEKLKEEVEDKDCMNDTDIIALIVILSVAVGLLLILSTILLLQLFNLFNRKNKVSDAYPPSQRPVEPTMHIPRLEFNHQQRL